MFNRDVPCSYHSIRATEQASLSLYGSNLWPSLCFPSSTLGLAKWCFTLFYLIKMIGFLRSVLLYLIAKVGSRHFICCFCYITEFLQCWVGSKVLNLI
jgi:hypothetical protein